MVKYIDGDFQAHHFSKDFGFKGSSEPSHHMPMHKADGGKVQHKAMGGPMQPQQQQPTQEPTISMPVSTAQRMAKGIALAGAQQGAAALARGVARPGSRPGLGGPTVGGPLSAPAQRPNMAPMGAPGAAGTPVPMKKGGHLNAKARNALPEGDFALAGRRYPIEDKNHARNALARVSQHGSPKEQSEVRSKVHRKFPDIGKK